MKIFDCHNDFLTELKSEKKINGYLSKINDETKIISAVWSTRLNEDEALNCLNLANNVKEKFNKTLVSIEDCHFINELNLEKIIQTSPFSAGLVWNEDNALGGGAYGFSGLTNWGEIVTKKFEENNIIIDLAHANEKTFFDVSRISNRALFCSHTACFGVKNHPRNLKDYQVKMIVESGGFVGLALVSEFLTENKKATINDICEHIVYFASKFGVDNLGFGTDFFGTENLPIGIKTYNDFSKLASKLTKIGFTNEEINKLFHKNFENFILKADANFPKGID